MNFKLFQNFLALEIIFIGTIVFAVKKLENSYFWKIVIL